MITSGFFFVFICQSISAQDSIVVTNPRITWVDQFPGVTVANGMHNKNKNFFDFILGKKNSVELTRPVNVTAKNKDQFWVLDQENGTIFQIKEKVGDIPHVKGKKFITFPSLVGICFFPVDQMLFTDSYLNKIFLYNPEKREITTFTDSLKLEQPTGVAYSQLNHEIWVVETKLHSITVLDEKGQFKKRIGKRGVEPGEFNYPTSICIDKSGRAYVVDALNFRVQVFSKSGELISVFGKNGDSGGDLARPKGIAVDSSGNIYIVDALFNAVQIFDISGNFLFTFGVQGHDKGEFWMPTGIFIDDNDYIYVADSYNARVQIFKFNN